MKVSLTNVLVLVLIVIGTLTSFHYIDKMAPSWNAKADQENVLDIQRQTIALENERIRAQWWTDATPFLLFGAIALMAGGGVVGLFVVTHRRLEGAHRQVDGSYCPTHYKAGRYDVPNRPKQAFKRGTWD